ncbi:hypothetical protein Pcar_3463 [Syntrophotalea carbinolica DSM 2380]|uniref:Uncharacterized protein n=1 Tax=Syntrophotalea carbinolica (strain DSM 2380 / NBRC 103641 / GraBd1) TaxID=338963 RepID=J9U417_SYNC1|nr:hypothetical protein Pcar_3463 [Syntrophotalea carbinolica DSM 2380]
MVCHVSDVDKVRLEDVFYLYGDFPVFLKRQLICMLSGAICNQPRIRCNGGS